MQAGAGIDVVVVSYNSSETLRRCVEPLARLARANVIVVDNASTDNSLAVLEDLPSQRIALRQNGGFAQGCNVGWRAGQAPYVLFLNPDAVIDADSLDRLAEVLDADETVGVVAPKILERDGSLDFSQRRFPRLRSTFAQAFFLHRIFPQASWSDEVVRTVESYEHPGVVEWVSGACFMIRRSLLEELDGLDEGFFMYCEDKDLCRRAWSNGYEVRYEPQSIAIHEGGVSAPRAGLLPVMAASRIRYARKHSDARPALAERLGVSLLALTHVIVSRGGRARRAGHAAAFMVAVGLRAPSHPTSMTAD